MFIVWKRRRLRPRQKAVLIQREARIADKIGIPLRKAALGGVCQGRGRQDGADIPTEIQIADDVPGVLGTVDQLRAVPALLDSKQAAAQVRDHVGKLLRLCIEIVRAGVPAASPQVKG